MEPKKNIMVAALSGGLVTGVLLIIYSTILYIFDATTSKYLSSINYVILAASLYIITKKYRDKELNGVIEYGQALGFGVLVGLFSSILTAIFTYILYKYIDPELINKLIDLSREQMLSKGVSDDQAEKALSMISWMMNPVFLAISGIFSFTFVSFIISLITSAIVKKVNSPFESDIKN